MNEMRIYTKLEGKYKMLAEKEYIYIYDNDGNEVYLKSLKTGEEFTYERDKDGKVLKTYYCNLFYTEGDNNTPIKLPENYEPTHVIKLENEYEGEYELQIYNGGIDICDSNGEWKTSKWSDGESYEWDENGCCIYKVNKHGEILLDKRPNTIAKKLEEIKKSHSDNYIVCICNETTLDNVCIPLKDITNVNDIPNSDKELISCRECMNTITLGWVE